MPTSAPLHRPSSASFITHGFRLALAQIAERDAAQGNRQRLAAGVPGLAGEHRQEDREHHQLVECGLENPDHRRRDEGGEQIELQPRMTKLEAARPRA